MQAQDSHLHRLMAFLNSSPTAFHAVHSVEILLQAAGFSRLHEADSWHLEPGGRHYLVRNGSALAAFTVGQGNPAETGFRILGAHTDSPSLKVKPQGEFQEASLTALRVELYGSAIQSTWLDRDLGMAGRVIVQREGKLEHRLLDTQRPVCTIPNLAIHLNREVNKGVEYNAHEELAPIFSESTSDRELVDFLSQELGVAPETILDADLFLYECQPARLTGAHGEFLSSGRLDNLAMCHAVTEALCTPSADQRHSRVGLLFDNEENGSLSYQGADSSLARDLLERIVLARGGGRDALFRASARSLLVSADMAHAWHPNWNKKHDKKYAPRLNGGPVIKQNANQRYGTSAATAATFETLCREVQVPVQRMINRADMACGSTIGAMSAANLSIATVDVGNPLLAMHSIRETAGARDHALMCRALEAVLNTNSLP